MNGPMIISFDITKQCNFNCLHCYNDSGNIDGFELTDHQVEKLIQEIAEIKPSNFCFCGGEPLLRSDLLIKMTDILTHAGVTCGLVTNGYLMTEQIAQSLKDVGINNIQISLDGTPLSHNKLRQKKDAYDKAINALTIVNKTGIMLGIAFSPTAWGSEDFDYVYQIAIQFGVSDIRVQELMPLGRGFINTNLFPTDIQYRKLRKLLLEKEILFAQGKSVIRISWGDPINHLLSFMSENTETNMIAIKSNGDIAISMYLPLIVGNVKEHTLYEYWVNGLNKIWKNEKIIEIANKMTSVHNMNLSKFNMPNVFFESDIRYKLI